MEYANFLCVLLNVYCLLSRKSASFCKKITKILQVCYVLTLDNVDLDGYRPRSEVSIRDIVVTSYR